MTSDQPAKGPSSDVFVRIGLKRAQKDFLIRESRKLNCSLSDLVQRLIEDVILDEEAERFKL